MPMTLYHVRVEWPDKTYSDLRYPGESLDDARERTEEEIRAKRPNARCEWRGAVVFVDRTPV